MLCMAGAEGCLVPEAQGQAVHWQGKRTEMPLPTARGAPAASAAEGSLGDISHGLQALDRASVADYAAECSSPRSSHISSQAETQRLRALGERSLPHSPR